MRELSRGRYASGILGVSAAAWLAGTVAAADAPWLRVPQRAIEPAACPIAVSPTLVGRVDCGWLRVPENRDLPQGRTVTLAFAVIQPERPVAGRDPILFIMGGNGSGLKALQRQHALAGLLARNDTVIFVDHRGATPWGQPDMSCPQFEEGLDAANPGADPAQVEACRRHLERRLDVNLYGPYEAAQDLRDLRLALGLARWNVYAVSYGTTIGQRLLGVDGGAIGRIVFDGMSGAESNPFAESFLVDPLLDLLDECTAAPDCAAAFPRFEQNLAEVSTRLAREPRRIDGVDVSNVEFLARIRGAMNDADRRGQIPLAVERSAQGDFSAWQRLAIPAPDGGGRKDPALTWPGSVCRDEYPRRKSPERQQPARRALPAAITSGVRRGDGEIWDWESFCPRLGFRQSAPETVAVPVSDVPALMLVGQLDLITPRTWSDQAARSLSDSRTVVFPLTDHWVLLRQPGCAGGIVQAFFQHPGAAPDLGCVAALPTTLWQVQ
jgi:pimeloyl-ACP methyl ester carboxylesterase